MRQGPAALPEPENIEAAPLGALPVTIGAGGKSAQLLEQGGMTTVDLLRACREVAAGVELVGAEVVEVIPTAVGSADVTALAARSGVRLVTAAPFLASEPARRRDSSCRN